MKMFKRFMLTWFAILTLVSGSAIIFAQADQKITLSPAAIDKQVIAGSQISFLIKITNNATEEKTFYLSGSSFEAGQNETGEPLFNDKPKDDTSIAYWFSFPQPSVTVKPGERQDVSVVMTVPPNPRVGGSYGAVVFSETKPDLTGKGPTVAIARELATLVLLTIPGRLNEEGRVVEFGSARQVFSAPPVNLFLRFQNSGNVHLRPSGLVEIYNMAGIKEAVIQINPQFGNVLPGSTRKFDIVWDPGKYYNLIPRFGHFRAEAIATYGIPINSVTLPAVTFWVIPIKFTALLIGGFVGLVLVLYSLLRLYRRQVIKSINRHD